MLPSGVTSFDLSTLGHTLPHMPAATGPTTEEGIVLPTKTPAVSAATESPQDEPPALSLRMETNVLRQKVFDQFVAAGSPRGKIARAQLPDGLRPRQIIDRQQELFRDLISTVPEYETSLNQNVGRAPLWHEYNNYGITPDSNKKIVVEDGFITFYVNNEKCIVRSDTSSIIKKQIFADPDSAIFADTARATKHKKGYQCFAIADGCSHGNEAKSAAEIAAISSLKMLDQELKRCPENTTTRVIAQIQLDTLQKAQQNLIERGETVGETTLTVATIAGAYLVVASVGDTKVFILRKGKSGVECIDITEASRVASWDPKDPGGRLGRYGADWRNLAIAVIQLEPGDVIVGCSDGVHDNLDPMHLGMNPCDFGHEETQWDMSNPYHVKLRQQEFRKNFVTAAGNDVQKIAASLTAYVSEKTLKTKLFMLRNPKTPVPKDYKVFSGKEDHMSLVVFEYEQKKSRGSYFSRG